MVTIELDGREVDLFLSILQHARDYLYEHRNSSDRTKELLLISRFELGIANGNCDYPYLGEFQEATSENEGGGAAAMRRALYEVIWIVTHPPNGNAKARPCPELSDAEIKARLKELIND
jgi:hypothetical protein